MVRSPIADLDQKLLSVDRPRWATIKAMMEPNARCATERNSCLTFLQLARKVSAISRRSGLGSHGRALVAPNKNRLFHRPRSQRTGARVCYFEDEPGPAAGLTKQKSAWCIDIMHQAPLVPRLASTGLPQRQSRVREIQRLDDDGSNSRCRGRTCRGGRLYRYNEFGRSLHRRLGDRCVLRWRGLPVMSWHSKPRQRFP
jgi:hypothetical protein